MIDAFFAFFCMEDITSSIFCVFLGKKKRVGQPPHHTDHRSPRAPRCLNWIGRRATWISCCVTLCVLPTCDAAGPENGTRKPTVFWGVPKKDSGDGESPKKTRKYHKLIRIMNLHLENKKKESWLRWGLKKRPAIMISCGRYLKELDLTILHPRQLDEWPWEG